MNAANCWKWVQSYGCTQMDFRTNLNVVEFVADKAKEYCETNEDFKLCEDAKESAILQIVKYRILQASEKDFAL